MNPADFRRLALSLPKASESSHMAHPDFRVGGKIFATLGYPDKDHGMVVLPPEEQARFVQTYPKVFTPAKELGENEAAHRFISTPLIR